MSKYLKKTSPEEVAFRDRQYIYRIFYDIGYGASSNAMDAYMFIKPTCDKFMDSSEYKDSSMGLYEVVESYINEHGWSEEVQSVNTLSEDYRNFEDFVNLYNQLAREGKEFTIDDRCFDRGLRNKFIVSLSDTEIERLGLDILDRDACKEKILSVLRGESAASKDVIFREDETVITDIELPSESNECITAVALCEDEVYQTCLERVVGEYKEVSAAYISSQSELRLSINRQIEYGGIVLGMEYHNDYYIIPLTEKESSRLYDLTNRECLSKYGISIPQYFEDLKAKETKGADKEAGKHNIER